MRSTSARTWVETTTVARAGEALDQLEQVAPALRVERADRLVEDQQLRLVEHRLGDPEPLAHPAGVRPDPPLAGFAETRPLERRADARPAAPAPLRPARRPTSSSSSRPFIQP